MSHGGPRSPRLREPDGRTRSRSICLLVIGLTILGISNGERRAAGHPRISRSADFRVPDGDLRIRSRARARMCGRLGRPWLPPRGDARGDGPLRPRERRGVTRQPFVRSCPRETSRGRVAPLPSAPSPDSSRLSSRCRSPCVRRMGNAVCHPFPHRRSGNVLKERVVRASLRHRPAGRDPLPRPNCEGSRENHVRSPRTQGTTRPRAAAPESSQGQGTGPCRPRS